MTSDGWRECVLQAAEQADTGDTTLLDLLAETLAEMDIAKQRLRGAGYGCTGVSLLRTVEEALSNAA